MVMILSFLEKKKFPRSRKNYNNKSFGFNNKGDIRIQQTAFMILAVFFFFVLVGLFFLGYYSRDLKARTHELEKKQTIASLQTLIDMAELSYDATGYEYLSLDEDKILVMSVEVYSTIWPVSSIKIYKVFPAFDKLVKCPNPECNYYVVYDSGQEEVEEYSTFVSLCRKNKEFGSIYDKCEIAKLSAGVENVE